MSDYIDIDLKMTKEGDLALGETDEEGKQDLAVTEDLESLEQDIHNRIITNSPDWELHTEIGGNLEDIVGEKNTREVAEMAEDRLRKTLTFDSRINNEDLSVTAIPTAHDEVTFYIKVDIENKLEPLVIPIPFNFIRGMMN